MLCDFRVVDLGVMTPCDKIIKTVLDERAGTYYHVQLLPPCRILACHQKKVYYMLLDIKFVSIKHPIMSDDLNQLKGAWQCLTFSSSYMYSFLNVVMVFS